MNFLNELTSSFVVNILELLLTALAAYLGFVLKNLCKKFIDSDTKKNIVKICVGAVEQMHKDLHGEDKLNKAIEYASEILTNKNIYVTSNELKLMIEASVAEFNDAFNSTDN